MLHAQAGEEADTTWCSMSPGYYWRGKGRGDGTSRDLALDDCVQMTWRCEA